MSFIETPQGVFHVRYHTLPEMAPVAQSALVDRVLGRSATGPVALVFELDAAIRTVDVGVPTFWLKVTDTEPLPSRLLAVGVVTQFAAVRVAVKGFHLASRLRGRRLEARPFSVIDEAMAWADERLRAAP